MIARLAAAALLLVGCATSRALRESEQHLEAGRPRAAVRVLEEALERRPDDARLQAELARALLASGQPERALAPARAAARSGDAEARQVLAEALIACGRADEALDVLDAAPSTPPWERLRGEALAALGRYAEAVEVLEPVLDEAPGAAGTLAWSLAMLDRRDEVRIRAAEIQVRLRDDPHALADAAAALLLVGDHRAAEGAAVDALAAFQSRGLNVRDEVREAERLRKAGALPLALRHGMRAFALRPNDGQAAWAMGTWFLEAGDARRAVDLLTHALEVPPYHRPGSETVGVMVAGQQDLSARDRARGRREIALALAEAWRRLGQPDREIEALQLAIEAMDDAPATIYLRLWDAARRAGRAELALQAAREAVLRDPTLREPALVVASHHARAGAVQSALRVALGALAAHPSDPELARLVADLYAGRGEFRLALQALEPALAAHPEDPDLRARHDALVRRVSLGY